MPQSAWSDVTRRLSIVTRYGEAYNLPSVGRIDAGLDAYEAAAGFRLPLSYRQFICLLGPGELSGYFRIYAPPYRRARRVDRVGSDITQENTRVRDPKPCRRPGASARVS